LKKESWIMLTICTILMLTLALLLGYAFFVKASTPAGARKFCKEFVGNVDSIVGNITIIDTNCKVWFNGSLPSDHKICLTNVPSGTVFIIEWRDWRGVMQERHEVLCTSSEVLRNDIPFAKPAGLTVTCYRTKFYSFFSVFIS